VTPGRVSRISIAPVKSLALVHPESVAVTAYGVVGDRELVMVDAQGRLMNGTRHGPMVRIRTSWDPASGVLGLTLPDGTVVEDEVLTGEPLDAVFYGSPRRGLEVQGPFAAALSAVAGEPVRLMRMERGEGVDRDGDGAVTLLSDAALEAMADQAGAIEPVDPRRFRMTFMVAGVPAHTEDSWMGRQVRVGGAVVRVAGNVGRCSITTQDPDQGVKSFDTLKLIAAARGAMETTEPLPFGVHAEVVEPGHVAVGDVVEVLD
jgi:uncharacterized protein YcbX